MVMNIGNISFPIFDGTDFQLWSKVMKLYFIINDLQKFIKNGYLEDKLNFKENMRKDNEALTLIFCVLHDTIFTSISEMTTSKIA